MKHLHINTLIYGYPFLHLAPMDPIKNGGLIIIYLVSIYILVKIHEICPVTGFAGLILVLLLLYHIVKMSEVVSKKVK